MLDTPIFLQYDSFLSLNDTSYFNTPFSSASTSFEIGSVVTIVIIKSVKIKFEKFIDLTTIVFNIVVSCYSLFSH